MKTLFAFLLIFVLTIQAHASVTAVATVSNTTNAVNVPIILDGSGSSDSGGATLTYLWKQTNGATATIIGRDFVKALVISITNTGSYSFQLVVSNGSESATNSVAFTVIEPDWRNVYVDGTLSADITNGTYSIANRTNNGTDGNAYKTIQAASTASAPGDKILIRGGTYQHTSTSGSINRFVMHTIAGTAIAPIRFQNFTNETVILQGFDFSDADSNNDGDADGPLIPAKTEYLFQVENNADYVQVSGLNFTKSQQYALVICGSFCYVDHCKAYDNWRDGIKIFHRPTTNMIQGTVLRWIEANHSRHAGGMSIDMDGTAKAYTICSAIVDALSWRNGYDATDTQVLPIDGDPAGGGNADGAGSAKYFDTNITSPGNYGTNNFLVRVIAFRNADDGFDNSIAWSLVEDCRSYGNGPAGMNGFKSLAYVPGMTYRGCIAYTNMSVGFGLRCSSGFPMKAYHLLSILNGGDGAYGFIAGNVIKNGVFAFNAGTDLSGSGTFSNNWSSDGSNASLSGDPKLTDHDFVLNASLPDSTIEERIAFVENQFQTAFIPASNSDLIDAGVVIPGYHCETADDDPSNPALTTDPGRHWKGSAPDLGAYEFGIGKTNPVVTWTGTTNATYPATLTATATATWGTNSVDGSFTYSPTNGTALNAGSTVVTITFTPSDTNSYNTVIRTATVTVAQGDPGVSWAKPVNWYYPAALNAGQLNASAVQAGSFAYDPALGAILLPGSRTLSATFAPTDTNYATITTNHSVTVLGTKAGGMSMRSKGNTNGLRQLRLRMK